ncbi:Abi family protein [Roseivirga spongicola]|uniref:CAAX protease n=1 Tax=Roseivirga spongicola TaxID=333140 RepID=A0A150X1Q4_9BACT|nr:Abi family protein [Roseivirga spongicola]KYG72670.1 CAAX protease [Roseivirga spongicola]WPZ10272.1 Abi family protein [Roseivirga spongicola]
MAPKPFLTIAQQIQRLEDRGMSFQDKDLASHFLQNISYYRLKGYWWDLQADFQNHTFQEGVSFEDVIDKYNFDRQLRLIILDAIERIEIALRTKMIYFMWEDHGPFWYRESQYFRRDNWFRSSLDKLEKEFSWSTEIFVVDHKNRFPNEHPEAMKILEVASMGTLSKIYKNIKTQLPAKSKIANSMDLNLHTELESWLEAIVYVRNIAAHHSRLWSRDLVKRPIHELRNPRSTWLSMPLQEVQQKRIFLSLTCMLYLCNRVTPGHQIKTKIKSLFATYPDIPIYKIGFLEGWEEQEIWV